MLTLVAALQVSGAVVALSVHPGRAADGDGHGVIALPRGAEMLTAAHVYRHRARIAARVAGELAREDHAHQRLAARAGRRRLALSGRRRRERRRRADQRQRARNNQLRSASSNVSPGSGDGQARRTIGQT